MKLKLNSIQIFFAATFLLISCGEGAPGQKEPLTPRQAIDASVVADVVVYDVVVKNPDPEDRWTEKCLRHLELEGLVDMLFEAIYREELIPYDYISNEPLSLKDIKDLENNTEFSRNNVGKIQFSEEWYFDQDNLRMEKRVNSLSLGYEVFDLEGNLRGYKPAFLVILN